MCISGDVHIGCFTSIFKNDEYVLQQMITSPISQKPPTGFEKKVMDLLRFSQHELYSGYSFKHSDGTNECNFGIVQLRLNDEEKYDAIAKHIKSNGERFEEGTFEDLSEIHYQSCCSKCEIL